MANEEQLALLKAGVDGWNAWREEEPDTKIDLRGANFTHANLYSIEKLNGVNLRGADLSYAKLTEAKLWGADLSDANLMRADLIRASLIEASLSKANLSHADLWEADLRRADLSEANLREVRLSDANLSHANLRRADLTFTKFNRTNLRGATLAAADLSEADLRTADLIGANLIGSNLIRTRIDNAKISKSYVYGVSVWDLEGEFWEQKDLIITPADQPSITVDNIKVAQFVYLILNNKEIRDVINTLTSKTVLILGRFALPERKLILDALRDKLREYDLLPIVFDFNRPTDKDFTETIKTLAGLSYFVIADVTNPKSSPLELQATVPDYQIPFVPIIQEGEQPFAMMVDLHKKYNWVLEPRSYDSIDTLMKALKPGIIDPAIKTHYELRLIKAKEQTIHPLRDFIDRS
jgi:uncharacterized protein YjbI with pentapeptide repeats